MGELADHAGNLTRAIAGAKAHLAVVEALLQRGEIARPLEAVRALRRSLTLAAPRDGDSLPLQFPRGRCARCTNRRRRGVALRWSAAREAWQPWCMECP